MKNLLFVFSFFVFCNCATKQNMVLPNEDTIIGKSITKSDLQIQLFNLTSSEFEGRKSGEKGQKLAAQYLVNYYKNLNIQSAYDSTYLQNIPKDFFMGLSDDNSENVVAFIKGSTYPNQYVIISAHYDHLGKKYNRIYAGADDDASGTSAVLEIAEAFKLAVDNGNPPKRSVVFLNFTGEEEGLFGSRYYTNFPIFPLKNTVANLNVDMIGRVDDDHLNNANYVYIIGSDKLSTELKLLSEKVNTTFTQLKLDYKFDDENDPNKFYYRSDHYNFAKNNIPIIFYFNGVHDDYHQPTDTPEKIDYNLLTKRTKLIFYTAWEIANRPTKLKLDKN